MGSRRQPYLARSRSVQTSSPLKQGVASQYRSKFSLHLSEIAGTKVLKVGDSMSDRRKSEVVITLTAVLNLYGDSALDEIIDAFALALAESNPVERRRRLAHALLRIITARVEAQRRRLGDDAGA
jgi:hypothetical protein